MGTAVRQTSAFFASPRRAYRLLFLALVVVTAFGIGTAVLIAILPRGESVMVWREGLGCTVRPPIVANLLSDGDVNLILEADSLAITEYELQVATPGAPFAAESSVTQLRVTAVGWPARFLCVAWDDRDDSDDSDDSEPTGDVGFKLAPGVWATVLWRALVFDLVVWGVTTIALLILARTGATRRVRVAVRAATFGMWITLLIAWLALLTTTSAVQRVFSSPVTFAEAHGVAPAEPSVPGTTFVGARRWNPMLAQVDWMFLAQPSTDRAGVVVSSGAIATLGFPFGALRDREWVWEASRLRNPELGRWRTACWILRTPPSSFGFLADWIVWGVVCFGVMTFPTAIRRLRRTRRAQCPACGYRRTTSAERCSECGVRFPTTWHALAFPNDDALT